MKKKKRISVLKLLLVIICIVSVIVSACANLMFTKNKTPKLFGRYIYVVGEDNPMSGDITTGAALISMDAENISIATGDIVLCYPADAPNTLTLRSISFIAEGENGADTYYTKDSYHEDTEGSIAKDRIVAVCTGYPESIELGQFITFAKSLNGILILLGVPALLLLIILIATIIGSRSQDDDEDEDDFGFYEYDDDDDSDKQKKNSHAKNGDPLYEPSPDVAPNPELERKKMSIAENFKQKEVNPDSPYQKEREKERTMQFMAQKSTGTSTAESSFASRNPNTSSSSAPTAETLREEMLRKTSETERTGTYNIRKTSDPVSDNTGILSTAQVAELSGGTPPTPAKETFSGSNIPAPRKSSSPDISDIIGKSTARSSKSPSDMSVDDLLKIIEEEKNKL